MERSIRIGKDFNVLWSIHKVVDGERQPYELAGKELVLRYRMASGIYKEATEWKAEGNVIAWTFRGKEQKSLGSYELILTENAGKDGMVTVDTCKVFKLVAHSCEETEGSGGDIVIQDIMLESDVAFAALRGPQGPQGPSGYDDTQLQQKISELEAENESLRTEVESQGELIEDLQNTKIDKEADDYYPQLSVGVADNLAGVDVVDSAFRIRRSGGGAITDGVARVQSIKGNSVVWNQLFDMNTADRSYNENGVHITDNRDGSYTISTDDGGATQRVSRSISVTHRLNIVGHKLLITGCDGAKDGFVFWDSFSNTIGTIFKNNTIVTASSNGQTSFTIIINEGVIVSQTTWKPRVFDLTLMFGAGNEPTTIEEFYARIPQGVNLHAYNEGEVISMRADGIKSVGVNQWDEEWELGGVDGASGQEYDSTARIRPVGYIEVLPNAHYYAKKPESKVFYLCFYDANKVFLTQQAITTSGLGGAFTTPKEAYYMRFTLADSTYNHDICINLSNADINGQYFPHEEASEDLSFVAKYFPQGLRSAGTAHDEIRYNKQSNKWEAVQRIGSVDMGSLKWSRGNGDNYVNSFYAQNALSDKANGHNILCGRYVTNTKEGWPSMTDADKAINSHSGDDYKAGIWIHDSSYTDAATLKASLQGVILFYELAEPIVTEIAEPFNLDYKVWNFGTEQMEATEPSAPLSAEITYGFNAIGKIKELESNQGVSKEYVDNAIASAITNELNGDF